MIAETRFFRFLSLSVLLVCWKRTRTPLGGVCI